jgi:putative Mn2+ efflux pump MntP
MAAGRLVQVTLFGESGFITVLVTALGLSADCFAVALGASAGAAASGVRFVALRSSLSFGFFQAIMPVLGWLAGRSVIGLISSFDHWVAFALLAGVGGHMIWESLHEGDEESRSTDISRPLVLLTLSFATSIDALAVGLSFGLIEISILVASLTIGIIAFAVTFLGFGLGRKAGELVGKRAEIIGGIVLIAIGLRILLDHLL